jgi:predicted O-methyltransferase YrrM
MVRTERVREVAERLAVELTPVAIGPVEGAALRDRVRAEEAVRTLETGLGHAVSTLFICEALLENGPDACHVAIDPYQYEGLPAQRTRYAGTGVRHLEQAGVRDLVELHCEASELVLPRLLAEGSRFDFAFLDGNHRFEGVFLDLAYSGRLLEEGSIVFADDAQLPAVRRAAAFFLANLGWTMEDDGREGEHEWLVLRTGPAEALQRPFDDFVDF